MMMERRVSRPWRDWRGRRCFCLLWGVDDVMVDDVGEDENDMLFDAMVVVSWFMLLFYCS